MDIPTQLEDEHFGDVPERGKVLVVEVLHDLVDADELAVVAADVVVGAARQLVAVRRHHDEHALRVHDHLLQELQRVQGFLASHQMESFKVC